MKRIITTLTILVAGILVSLPMNAAKKDRANNEIRQDTYTFAEGKFVINGNVSPYIPDSCYNIYITDLTKPITDADLVACVPVKDKKFRFETELPIMKTGRIRAILPGGKLSDVWMDICFIPSFTVDMTINNGYYDIHNKTDYEFLATAWLNHDSMRTLYRESENAKPLRLVVDSDTDKLKFALESYNGLLTQIKQQIQDVKNNVQLFDAQTKMIAKLVERMDSINAKMEALIDKYAASIQ